ncbi:unnamed protein product [Rhodiola kirilowii]
MNENIRQRLARSNQKALELRDVPRINAVYFPEVRFDGKDWRLRLISDLADFFSSPTGLRFVSQAKGDDGVVSVWLDFYQFRKMCDVSALYEQLEEAPKEALLCICAAVHQVLILEGSSGDSMQIHKVNIRLHNYPESVISLKNLKAASIDRIVSVRGTVVKVSTVKPLVLQMPFECAKCSCKTIRNFPDGKFSPPTSCGMQGCKSRTFNPLRSAAQCIDFQKIRVQEIQRSENHEEGRVPRTVECELTEDLVDTSIPGDVVTVTGIIKVINSYMDIGGGKSKNKNQELCDLFSFSTRDLEFVGKFSEEYGSDTFRQILQSICPSIYGHELVKAGITLALFGGVRKHSMDQNKVPVRGDIHVIIVGDPGLGKSQLLQAAASVSRVGFMFAAMAQQMLDSPFAVVRDSMTNDYAFEAGAMVLADGGLCCIDEFDKMTAEHQALLEAMEQQCVSVAKAGLIASLSARTSVLAAANPVNGHYNLTFMNAKNAVVAKTVNENLKMSAALLSRFDLVFILLDKPDELLDKRVSDHIMSLHTSYDVNSAAVKKMRVSQNVPSIDLSMNIGSLAARLRLDPNKDRDFIPLPSQLLRKYIAYARNFVFPRMSRPAADILQKFYLKLRDRSTSADSTPITARQLESLVRLAEARARVDFTRRNNCSRCNS